LYREANFVRPEKVGDANRWISWHCSLPCCCCGPIHRGAALAGDLVIVARLDARLVALNRADGKIVWDVPIVLHSSRGDGYGA
jgi:hypothetical protein